MMVYKCDSCKKIIKGKKVLAGYSEHSLGHNTFCENCGKPVLDFLKSVGFSKEDEKAVSPTKTSRKQLGVLSSRT